MRIIYGINPVAEALRAGSGVEKVLVSRERKDRSVEAVIRAAQSLGVPVEMTDRAGIERLAGVGKHQGVAAVITGEFEYKDIEDLISAWKSSGEPAFFLILDSIQDPQNLGSLVRTGCAAGVHGIIIPKDRASSVTPTVVKASAGATAHTPIARETNLVRAIERLKEAGVWITAVEAGCPKDIYSIDLAADTAIVIGSEGRGIRRLVRESCDICAKIPMAGKLNSMNAAQAGAVAMFEVRRQRTF